MNCYGKYLVIVMSLMVGLLFVNPTVPYAQEECAGRDGCSAGSEDATVPPKTQDICPDNTSSATVKAGDTICHCMPQGGLPESWYVSSNGSCANGCDKIGVTSGNECYFANMVAVSQTKDCPKGCTQLTTVTTNQNGDGCTVTISTVCTPGV